MLILRPHDPWTLPYTRSPLSQGRQRNPSHSGYNRERLGREEHYSCPCFFRHVVQLYMNAPNCHEHQNGVHVDVCKLLLPAHGSIVLRCLTVFVPRAKEGPQSMQRHLHCTYLRLQSRLEMVAYIALRQTDTHKQTQAHAGQGESAFWECLLKPKMKSEVWQSGYQNLEDNVQLSGLLYGSCDVTALWTFRLLHLDTHIHTHYIHTHTLHTYSHTETHVHSHRNKG